MTCVWCINPDHLKYYSEGTHLWNNIQYLEGPILFRNKNVHKLRPALITGSYSSNDITDEYIESANTTISPRPFCLSKYMGIYNTSKRQLRRA